MSEPWYRGATKGQWLALAAALLGWMFDGFEQGIFPLVMRPALIEILDLKEQASIAADKSVSEDVQNAAKKEIDSRVLPWYGYITAAFLVGAAFGGWSFGWLGDRIGRVRAMMLSVLAYSIFTGLCGLAETGLQLVGLRFMAALGMGGEWALGVALVMESWRPHARPVLAGLIGAAANVGIMLAAVLVLTVESAGIKIADGNWRYVLGACALPALLTFFIRMFVPESAKWEAASKSGPKPSMVEIFKGSMWKRTIPAALICSFALLGTWSSVQWISPWVNQVTGQQKMATYAQFCSGGGAVVFALFAAILGAKVSRRWGYFTLAVGAFVVCQFLFRSYEGTKEIDTMFFVTVFFVGGLTASFYGWFPLYLPELFPTRLRATGQGFCFNIGRLIAAVGAIYAGWLTGPNGPFPGNYAAMGATLSMIYLVAMVVCWFAPETKGKPLPE